MVRKDNGNAPELASPGAIYLEESNEKTGKIAQKSHFSSLSPSTTQDFRRHEDHQLGLVRVLFI